MHTLLFGRPDPATLLDAGRRAAPRRSRLARGWPAPRGSGPDTTALDAALAAWAGVENLEERMVPGRIDPLVLAHLRTATG